jgi:hypothetical protein
MLIYIGSLSDEEGTAEAMLDKRYRYTYVPHVSENRYKE